MKGSHFVVDMARCVGCFACGVACKDRAGVEDDVDLLRVEVNEGGTYPQPTLAFRVVHCFHCAEPPCVDACPEQATRQLPNGLVVLDALQCTGCGACVEACPFGAVVIHQEGVAVKCDGCGDEVDRGWDPTCVRACPLRALSFGPLEDPVASPRRRDWEFDEYGTGARVLYLRRDGA